jgi:hypothetical protein
MLESNNSMTFNQAKFFHPDILVAVAKQSDGDFWQFQVATKDKSTLLILSYDELVAVQRMLSDAVISEVEVEDEIEPDPPQAQVRVYQPTRQVHVDTPDAERIRATIAWLHEAYPKNRQVQMDLLATKLGINIDRVKQIIKNQQPWKDKIIEALNQLH